VHPGWAKGKLVNALHLMARIIETLPQATETPEVTEGRDGFWHVTNAGGSAARAEITIILRDFDGARLAARGEMLRAVCNAVAATEPRAKVACTITKQYRNMREALEKDMRPVEKAVAAYEACGITPRFVPIRGGTDGSRFTELGLPTPNIFTGMQEVHGPREWVSLQDMQEAVRVCLKLTEVWAKG
jgi:tripeptide aminopeptidase